jgi:quercetin dioxygenase-like cupin family protein
MPITIIRPGDRQLQAASSVAPKSAPSAATDRAKAQIISADQPYAHLSQLEPGTVLPLHSHSQPEITIVLSGTVRIAGQECEAGSIFVIPANEKYALEAGDAEPLTFVVVRPAKAEFQS